MSAGPTKRQQDFHHLPWRTYIEGEFGPPVSKADDLILHDLQLVRYRPQRAALMALQEEIGIETHLVGAGVDRRALEDLCNAGLALPGVILEYEARTFRLSRLGRIVKDAYIALAG